MSFCVLDECIVHCVLCIVHCVLFIVYCLLVIVTSHYIIDLIKYCQLSFQNISFSLVV